MIARDEQLDQGVVTIDAEVQRIMDSEVQAREETGPSAEDDIASALMEDEPMGSQDPEDQALFDTSKPLPEDPA